MIVFIIIVVLIVWMLIGLRNYSATILVLKDYIGMVEDVQLKEDKETSTYEKTLLFNTRHSLINKNLALEEMRVEFTTDEKSYKLKSLLSFLLLGPLYNLK